MKNKLPTLDKMTIYSKIIQNKGQCVIIKKGTLFLLTDGEHLDYKAIMLCKIMQNIDIRALQDEYMALYLEQNEYYHFRQLQFIKWLIDKNICKELDYLEWCLGGYDTTVFSLTPNPNVIVYS